MGLLIFLEGDLVAVAGREKAYLAPAISQLPTSSPRRRRVALMCAFAHAVSVGDIPGPYSEVRAHAFATAALSELESSSD